LPNTSTETNFLELPIALGKSAAKIARVNARKFKTKLENFVLCSSIKDKDRGQRRCGNIRSLIIMLIAIYILQLQPFLSIQ
jgi:hypothetical protein